jgi:hypothetical protein
MKRLRTRLLELAASVGTLLFIPFAPVFLAWESVRRASYRRRRAQASEAQLRLDADRATLYVPEPMPLTGGMGPVRLWEWYLDGGTASNAELEEQLLEIRRDGRWQTFRLAEARYSTVEDLRARGIRVRGIYLEHRAGLLGCLLPLGLGFWLILIVVLMRPR